MVPGDGQPPYEVVVEDAAALLRDAAAAAAALGMGWHTEVVALKPTSKLAHLISESRKLTSVGSGDDEDGD